MYLITKLRLSRLLIAITLSLELVTISAIAPSTAAGRQAASKQSNPPPPPTNPGSSAAGGRRDSLACPQDGEAPVTGSLLTALSPTNRPNLTLAERPTFLVYVPGTSAENAEFSLRDRTGRGVYRTTIALANTPNLISISLPDQEAALEVGKQYVWSFAIICNPSDRLEDRFVTGTIQRTELEPPRLHQIEQAAPRQRLALYQEDGIWYDALALLFELKRSQPDDLSLRTAWGEFLESGGVDSLIDSPANQ